MSCPVASSTGDDTQPSLQSEDSAHRWPATARRFLVVPGRVGVKLGPPAVVLIVALMRATREVGDAVRRDQQAASARGCVPASVR